ncbi:galactose oxidase [Gigaspora margarita]|uniref:Galactose oxidase n=1 Tax=Gigaspora margarita TaxID=4874 RepID=A0A8H4ESW0_GIGMA|nr:galactose oxidase [Gigaspora margarita]
MPYLSFFFITLLLFNYIHSAQCQPLYFAGGSDFKSYYTGTKKLYYYGLLNCFYIDLNNLSLDGNIVIDSSKWIQVTKNENTSLANWPFLGGISNDNLFFAKSASYGTPAEVYVDTFDTTLNQWKTNLSLTGKPSQYFLDFKPWITDASTRKAYSLQYIPGIIEIFDTVKYAWANSSVIPQTYQTYLSLSLSNLYGPPQVLLSSGVILYFASEPSSSSATTSNTASMDSILSYNIKTNSWQLINATGQVPNLRSDYTAVSTSDGRVIIYGGTSNKLPANPPIVVLNTSNYAWSVPSEINTAGPLTKHTSIMVNNYMITAFGVNVTERNFLLQNNKNIYKLDISDPLAYKWSVLSIYNDNSATLKPISSTYSAPNLPTYTGFSNTPSTFPSLNNDNNTNLPIIIGVSAGVVVVLSFAGFLFYKSTRPKPDYILAPDNYDSI